MSFCRVSFAIIDMFTSRAFLLHRIPEPPNTAQSGIARTTRPHMHRRPRGHASRVQGRRTVGEKPRAGSADDTATGPGTGVRDNQSRYVLILICSSPRAADQRPKLLQPPRSTRRTDV